MSIAYYCGMLYNSSEKEDELEEHDKSLNIALNFCGNGSKIIKWLGDENIVKKIFVIFLFFRLRNEGC